MNENARRILVIGGAGYLGAVLVRQLLDSGYRVRVMDLFLFGKESLAGIWAHPNLEVVAGDIRCVHQVTECLDDVYGVILLAALVGEPACDVNPKETVDVNLLGTKIVAAVCRHYEVGRFIFASTDSIYGIREGVMREESEKNPISLYAQLKLQAEQEVLSLRNGMFQPVILRMSTLYGYSPRMRFDLVVNILAMHATTQGKIRIFGGKQWRPFVHVADAAKSYRMALEASLEDVGGQIFNVGSNEQNYQIGMLADLVREVFPDVIVEVTPQTPDLRDYYVNCDKITKTLGYTTEWSVTDGISEIRDALKSQKIPDPTERRFYNVKHR